MPERVMTGDRPTGKLHLGHYVGSLRRRLDLQETHPMTVLVADLQALTTHAERPQEVRQAIRDVTLDYLAVGLEPARTTIALQSLLPELAELAAIFGLLVTVGHLYRNPTIKAERASLDIDEEQLTYGFLGYPVSQAADIVGLGGVLVPVGADQVPHIEEARRIVRRFNSLYGETLVEPRALVGEVPRLSGLYGKDKMSKSLGNAIFLADPPDVLRKKVRQIYTDPTRLRATDPGHLEGNVVFEYLDAFDPDREDLARLKDRYQAGGVGDVAVKERLFEVLDGLLAPIRERRALWEQDPEAVDRVLQEGTTRARAIAIRVLSQVRDAMGLPLRL